jgi:hypothetical protein
VITPADRSGQVDRGRIVGHVIGDQLERDKRPRGADQKTQSSPTPKPSRAVATPVADRR